jgi:superfamily II DNA or RNA helicase
MIPVDYPDVDRIRLYGRTDEYGDLEYNDIYQKGVVSNMWRNYLIAKICEKEVQENQGQVLVLVERIEHGECIQECLDYLGSNLRYLFLNGELDSVTRQQGLLMLKNGELDVVISTAILDEGVDVPNINALVYARGMKSTRKLLQGIGRGLRKKQDGSNLRMYDFIDYTAEILGSQTLQRMEILSKEKFSIKQRTAEEFLGISEAEFQSVISELDTTYDSKYVNV